ncbi:hypothetical protein CGZ75_07260 [Paenibacillus herberti]|uniref:Transposase n=1 Tax=Paenibacillus herberti TaxID=1619309 RepID=A0A229P2H5_9BACL|nr:hypothetical protein CGZ75_07260 [Paenibacillus herberti]
MKERYGPCPIECLSPLTFNEPHPKSWTHAILVQAKGCGFSIMSRYNMEIRQKVVHEVLKHGLSENEADRKYGMNHATVNQWVAAYINNGEYGIVDKATKRTFTGEQKLFILDDMQNYQLSYKGATKKHGVADSAIRRWQRQFLKEGVDALYIERRGSNRGSNPSIQAMASNVDSTVDMEQENRRLRMEVDYLKKLHALVQEKRKCRIVISSRSIQTKGGSININITAILLKSTELFKACLEKGIALIIIIIIVERRKN